jgi:glycine/D-amino acid oxidase-like deaminating enzyme
VKLGVYWLFSERVTAIIRRRGKVVGVRTDKGGYATDTVINAAGACGSLSPPPRGLDVPGKPDSHEAASPSRSRTPCTLVVDLRPTPGARTTTSTNTSRSGLFCITPEPLIVGSDGARPAPSCRWSPGAWWT